MVQLLSEETSAAMGTRVPGLLHLRPRGKPPELGLHAAALLRDGTPNPISRRLC